MPSRSRLSVLLIVMILTASCSSLREVPQPVLERDGRVLSSSDEARQDVRTCQGEMEKTAPVSIQPRWLPPLATTGNGVVTRTVDVPHHAWPSGDAYRRALERCLTARGYEVRGWE